MSAGTTETARDSSLKTEDSLMTYLDLSKYLRISIQHTFKLVKDDKVPKILVGKRSVRFRREAIDSWLKKTNRSRNVS